MITQDLSQIIRRQVADSIDVEMVAPSRFEISTPFMFSDGDHCGFTVTHDPQSGWQLSDEGEVASKASYEGIDVLSPGRVERFRKLVEFYGLTESKGALSLPVDDDDFGRAFFVFSQACLELNRVARLPAEKKRKIKPRANFRDKVLGIVEASLPSRAAVERQWSHPDHDPHGIYPVDAYIPTRKSPILLFACGTDLDCLHSTVSCLHYRQMEFDFTGVAVTDEQNGLQERNIIALRDAVNGDLFPVEQGEELAEFLKAKVA